MNDSKIIIPIMMGILPFSTFAQKLPNIVMYIADDHGCQQSNPYGDNFVRTPNMKKISSDGITFDRAFVASPASGPSRAALLSGLMPCKNGAESNHTVPTAKSQCMIKRLQDLGYEVAAIGKVAHGEAQAALNHFDYLKITGNIREKMAETVKEYLDNRKSNKPLCLLVGDRRPHVSWIKNSIYNESKIVLPPYLIDTKETREHWGRYLTDITGLDKSIGEVDNIAKKYFGNSDYIFLYTADHGAQWPFGKWNLYDTGIQTSMLVRWNGKIKPNTRTNAMVSWIDIFPTFIDIAGGGKVDNIDGKSFKNVLLGTTNKHRDYIFTTHTSDGKMNIYPIRSVRSERYKYIRNLRPDCYHSNHSDILRKGGAGAYWDSWDEKAKTDKNAAAIISRYYQRPVEEFYDLKNDPGELHNIINDSKYNKVIAQMSQMLDNWMIEQVDKGRLKEKPYLLTGPTPHECNIQKKKNMSE